jgi:hypothetical protein
LVLGGGIGSAVTKVGIGYGGLYMALVGVAIRQGSRQGSVGTGIDLGQASVGNGRVSLNKVGRLGRGGLGLRR